LVGLFFACLGTDTHCRLLLISSYSNFDSCFLMNLNDPFGRMARKHAREYEALSKALQTEGIHSKEAAEEVLARITHRAKIGAGIVLGCLLLGALAAPKAVTVSGMLAIFFLFWVYTNWRNGHAYVHRYIEEFIEGKKDVATTDEAEEKDQT
jgi:hypothetical protein